MVLDTRPVVLATRPVVLERALDPVIPELALYKRPSFKPKTAKKKAKARKAKMVLARAKAARRQQQIVDDIDVCDTILERVKAELVLQLIKRVRRAQQEQQKAEESKSESDSDSFMYSRTRFYGGGPSQSSDLESDEEGDKSAASKEGAWTSSDDEERPSKRVGGLNYPMDAALSHRVMKEFGILETMATRFVNHMSKVVIRKVCQGCLVSKYKSISNRPVPKTDLEILIQSEGIIATLNRFRVYNSNGYSMSDQQLSSLLREFDNISQYMSLHSQYCEKKDSDWYSKSRQRLIDSMENLLSVGDSHETGHLWFTDKTTIPGTPSSMVRTPLHSSTPKSQVGTPRQNPLLKHAANNNARRSILRGIGGEAIEEEEEEEVTFSSKLKGAKTREEVEDVLQSVAADKKTLVCPFCDRKFTQHRNLTAHHKISCRAVKASLGRVLSSSVSSRPSSVAQEPARGNIPRPAVPASISDNDVAEEPVSGDVRPVAASIGDLEVAEELASGEMPPSSAAVVGASSGDTETNPNLREGV